MKRGRYTDEQIACAFLPGLILLSDCAWCRWPSAASFARAEGELLLAGILGANRIRSNPKRNFWQ